jgi:hypothetical protein
MCGADTFGDAALRQSCQERFFFVIEAEFVLGGFEAVLNGPAVIFDLDQGFDGNSDRAPLHLSLASPRRQ